MKMTFDVFAKTHIICHGARAARNGERLIRAVWKYLRETDFVKGSVCKEERDAMRRSITRSDLIIYPDDLSAIPGDSDLVIQIFMGDDKYAPQKSKDVTERCGGAPCIALVLNEGDAIPQSAPYIRITENQLADTFLDIFSIYTFPQEFGADFEELTPIFNHRGEVFAEKTNQFTLCLMRKAGKDEEFTKEITHLQTQSGNYVLASRLAAVSEIKYYGIS